MTLPWPPPDPRIAALIDDAAPGIIGDVDDARLADLATRLDTAASRLVEVASSIDDAHTAHAADIGSVAAAISDGRLRLTGPDGDLSRTWAAVTGVVTAIGDYRRLVAETSTELNLLAAVTDREMAREEIATRIGVDGAASAHLIGREAIAGAADGAVESARELSTAPTGGFAAGGFALGGVAGLAGVAATVAAGAVAAVRPVPHLDVDLDALTERAAQLDAAAPGSVRMAIGVGVASTGEREIVVGTSDPAPYLRCGVDLADGERIVGTGAAPEAAIVADLIGRSVTPLAVAAVGIAAAMATALAARGISVIDVTEMSGDLTGGAGEDAGDPTAGPAAIG